MTELTSSMRQRSPFVIATIIYIGQKCEDAGGGVTPLQTQLREHAEKIGESDKRQWLSFRHEYPIHTRCSDRGRPSFK